MSSIISIYSLLTRSLQPGNECNDTKLELGLPYAFTHFTVISRVLLKIKLESASLLILTAPMLSNQPCYPELLNLYVKEPALLPQGKEVLISSKSVVHPLMLENSLTLAAWLVAGKPFCVREFQETLLTLS